MSRIIAAVLVLLVALRSSTLAEQTRAGAALPAGFAQPEFALVWQRTDAPVAAGQVARSWIWGPAPGQLLNEPFAEGKGGVRTVQYYDKARMELNEAVTSTLSPWRVTTGLLVNEMVTGQIQVGATQFLPGKPSDQAVAGDVNVTTNPRYSDFVQAVATKADDRTGQPINETLSSQTPGAQPGRANYGQFANETKHNIADVFWTYLQQTGPVSAPDSTSRSELLFDWVYLMGYPISEPYWSKVTVAGKSYNALIQLFQRRTLIYIAEMPAGWQVQMGNVGQHYYSWRYGPGSQAGGSNKAGGPGQAGPLTPPTATPVVPGAFVTIQGNQFVYANAPVKLKGTNYWQSNAPFAGMWSSWDGPKVLAELQRAKEMGVNTVRAGLPYDHGDTMDVLWNSDQEMRKIRPWIQRQMTQLLQISSLLGMKVIFVLFEWNDTHPKEGSAEEQQNLNYLDGIVTPFANDDRILAWDIHNEPDFYQEWTTGNKDRVIEWLSRMARQIKARDNRHPITVGMGDYRNLWAADNTGRTVLDFVDFASFHSYDANSLPTQVGEVKARTAKPILLEEMGWPTNAGEVPPAPGVTYDEPTQTFLYTKMLADARKLDIAGVVQWSLFDFTPASTAKQPNFEEFFGLVRLDGTLKPAAEVFKQTYTSRDLPSLTTSRIPLDTADRPIQPDVKP